MPPYEGNEPYIFISYSHKDADDVLTVINALEKKGFRIWFDAGVEAGSEWPEYIASHLRKSACILAFISPNFASSLNCRRELTFAQDLNIPMLNVYLSEVQLSDGLRMQLGLNQCLFKSKFSSQKDFEDALCRAELLRQCCPSQSGSTNGKATNHVMQAAEEVVLESAVLHKGRRDALTWITSLIQLSYGLTGILAIDYITRQVEGGFARFLWMILPNVLTTALSLILFRTVGRTLTKKEKADATTATAGFWFFALLIAIVGGVFRIHTDASTVAKIFSSIGLNLLPGFISMIMVGCMDE